LHINLVPFSEILETEELFYIVGDIDYVYGSHKEVVFSITSTSSYRFDKDSQVLSNNISDMTNTFNFKDYLPKLIVTFNNVLKDAIFEGEQNMKILTLSIRTDYQSTTLGYIMIDLIMSGNSTVKLSAKKENDLVLFDQSLQHGLNIITFNETLLVNDSLQSIDFYMNLDEYLQESQIRFIVSLNENVFYNFPTTKRPLHI
jgi:hypothetical protein